MNDASEDAWNNDKELFDNSKLDAEMCTMLIVQGWNGMILYT